MTTPPDPPPDGDQPAAEPGKQDFPDWPMTAADAAALLPKNIG